MRIPFGGRGKNKPAGEQPAGKKKAGGNKKAAKKPAAKRKPAAKKKPATAKKTGAKRAAKPVAKKSVAKKSAAKKPVAKKSAAKKKAAEKQPAAEKQAVQGSASAPVGVTSQVGVNDTWIRVFEKNEQVEDAERMTDEQISEFMKSEFPNLDATLFDRVEIARGKYNRGGFHKKDKSGKRPRPKVHSNPYAPEDSSGGAAFRPNPRRADAGPRWDHVATHQKDFKAHKK